MGPTPQAGQPRILVVRCCRTARFAEAVALLREHHPTAKIWGLCHREFLVSVRACGVHRAVAYGARGFGLLTTPLRVLRLIRQQRFDVVALPYMEPDDVGHANVHRMALAFRTRQIAILPAGRETRIYSRADFVGTVGRTSRLALLRLVDIPLLLAGLATARFIPRRRVAHPTGSRLRVLHVITTLGAGGAQVQLAQLVSGTPSARYDTEVLVLNRGGGDFTRDRLPGHIRVRYLASWPGLMRAAWQIFRLCRRERIDIVHTWLFHANIVGALGARLARVPRVIASVRNMSRWKREWYARPWFRAADALMSRLADVVTVNGEALVADHAEWARCRTSHIRVVPNGCDPRLASTGAGAREWLRRHLGLPPERVVIGTVARLAPEKDLHAFLHLVQRVRRERSDVSAVIVGDGILRHDLETAARELDLQDAVVFMGERQDATRVIAGLDLFVLTSACEGFPNVLLEAALLGVPSVATDVGASRDVLVEDDALFAPGDLDRAHALVTHWIGDRGASLLRAQSTRQHVLRNFTVAGAVSCWLAVYEERTDFAPATRTLTEGRHAA